MVANGTFSGPWWGWGTELTDEDGDGLYCGSVSDLVPGVYEYVHAATGAVDEWSGWGVSSAVIDATCAKPGTSNFTFSIVAGETSTVCHGWDVCGCGEASSDSGDGTDPDGSDTGEHGAGSGTDTGSGEEAPPEDTAVAPPTLLDMAFENPGFESDTTHWTMMSGVSEVDPSSDATSYSLVRTGDTLYGSDDIFTAREGTTSLKMWGRFWGVQSFMYATQTLSTVPGAVIDFSAQGWHHRDDAITTPTTYGALKVQFLDQYGRVLTEHVSNTVNHETPTDTWVTLAVTATAPHGAASVRAGPFHLHCEGLYSECYDPGATYFDDLSIAHTAAATPPGEYVFGSETTATAIVRSGAQYFMLREGEPFGINGLSMGNVTDALLASASARGANAIRTYGLGSIAADMAKAEAHGMGVFAGHWISHSAASFSDESYKATARSELIAAIEAHKDSPALVAWVLGNEVNLGHSAAEMAAAWAFIEELAQLVHELDPEHPVMTVLAGTGADQISEITAMVPSLDALGMNSYGGIYGVGDAVNSSTFDGPFMVTEWGVNGFWERPSTDWGRPIEETSAEKRSNFSERYALMKSWNGYMGNFAFLWGFKQERTPTWFSITIEDESSAGRPDFLNGEFTSIADVLQTEWTGTEPDNLAPDFSAIRLNDMAATDSVVLTEGTTVTATVELETHGETSPITYYWELVREIDPSLYGYGGSAEPRPVTHEVYGPFAEPTITFTLPTDHDVAYGGEFRLFAYGFDEEDTAGAKRVATANLPLRVVSE